jgi:hypothetical protein
MEHQKPPLECFVSDVPLFDNKSQITNIIKPREKSLINQGVIGNNRQQTKVKNHEYNKITTLNSHGGLLLCT